jgi:hypothetical protein
MMMKSFEVAIERFEARRNGSISQPEDDPPPDEAVAAFTDKHQAKRQAFLENSRR